MNKKKIIIDLLCTSINSSGLPQFRPSLEEASILLSKVSGEYESELYNQQLRYDKLEEDNLNDIDFEKRVEKISERIEKQVQSIYQLIPSLIIEETYEIDINNPEVAILKAFLHQFNRFGNNEGADSVRLMDYPEKYQLQIESGLLELSKTVIARDVAKHVDQELEINGKYSVRQEFASVQEACIYFYEKLNKKATIDDLKDQIRNSARIFDNDKVVEWKVINKRINSWITHQDSLYNGVRLTKK